MSSLTHSIPCPASDRCDTGDVSVPPPRRSAPVFVCFIATQEFNVVQSNTIYNLKSFYTCIKSSVVRAPGRYQAFFWVLIDLIIGFLGLIIKAFDNQTEIWACRPISQPAPSPPSSYQPSDTVDYLRFLYVSSSSVKTPLSSQVGNIVLIDVFNVYSRVLSIVLFLRASCCFPAEKKTRSIPSPDAGQPWNCLHILTTFGYVWLT
jgi:hypothetical protein